MRIFWEKAAKSSANPGLPSRVVTPDCCYKFVSSAKRVLFRSKKNQVTTANILSLLLPHFCTIFFQTL